MVAGLILTLLLLRRVWVDPIRQYLQNKFQFELKSAMLVGGEVPLNSEGRRVGFHWLGKIELADRQLFFEKFSRGLFRNQINLFPIRAWVLQKKRPEPIESLNPRGKNYLAQILLADIKWHIRNLVYGPHEVLIGLDEGAIDKIPKPKQDSYADFYWLTGVTAFSLSFIFFFTLPGIPDGRWLEVKAQWSKMASLNEACRDLNAEQLSTTPLSIDWFREIQYTAENIDFDRLTGPEKGQVVSIFFEDCRERKFLSLTQERFSDATHQKLALTLLDEIITYPRSVARLELARDLLKLLLEKYGTSDEKEKLEAWSQYWERNNPRYITEPEELVNWIRFQGNQYREWGYTLHAHLRKKVP